MTDVTPRTDGDRLAEYAAASSESIAELTFSPDRRFQTHISPREKYLRCEHYHTVASLEEHSSLCADVAWDLTVPPQQPKYDAFICYYRRSGAALAQLFRAKLESLGLRVFLDVEATYWGPFPNELKTRVGDSPYFIVLLTRGCLESSWMSIEIAEALRTRRRILVVREAGFELPPEHELSPTIRGLAMLNHLTYVHDFSDEVMRRVAALVRAPAVPRRRRSSALVTAIVAICVALIGAAYWRSAPISARSDEPSDRQRAATRSFSATAREDAAVAVGPHGMEAREPERRAAPLPDVIVPTPPPGQTTSSGAAGSLPSLPMHQPTGSAQSVVARADSVPEPVRSAAPLPSRPNRAGTRPTPPVALPPAVDPARCSPNYFFDANGDKRFKRECFLGP